jgi:hypothetical protein
LFFAEGAYLSSIDEQRKRAQGRRLAARAENLDGSRARMPATICREALDVMTENRIAAEGQTEGDRYLGCPVRHARSFNCDFSYVWA